MKFAFYAAKCLPVHAFSLDERPVGGIETGLIHLAAYLQARGHDVTVFTAHKNPPASSPRYLPFSKVFENPNYDVFVAVKDWTPVFFNIPAKVNLYWTGDGFDQYANFGLGDPRVAKRYDAFLAVSEWHATTLCEASGFPREKTINIGNGLHLPDFDGSEPRDLKRLMYSSAPNRGLELVPFMMREIRKRVPDACIHVFSGLNVYDTDKPYQGPEQAHFQRLSNELRGQEGIVLHGNVLQKQLAREFMKSALLCYPNTCFETCCITAMEAQAAGCPVIASANSGLIETVRDCGVLIADPPGSPPYLKNFISSAIELLTTPSRWHSLSQRALHRSHLEFSWSHVAARLENICSERML